MSTGYSNMPRRCITQTRCRTLLNGSKVRSLCLSLCLLSVSLARVAPLYLLCLSRPFFVFVSVRLSDSLEGMRVGRMPPLGQDGRPNGRNPARYDLPNSR